MTKDKPGADWLSYHIKSDLYRYEARTDMMGMVVALIRYKGFRLSFWYRICRFFDVTDKKVLLFITKRIYRRLMNKYGVDIATEIPIGPGLYIPGAHGVFINRECVLGENITLSPNVVFGYKHRGSKKGGPVLKDNVFVGPGAVIIGKIVVGSNVAIGANCVLTKDAPDNAVVGGVPGVILSMAGAKEYINNVDYHEKIALKA